MNGDKTYKGSCFCGAVEFDVTGDPVVMGYCHCESCRHWSAAGPVNAFSLWAPDAIEITKGEDNILTYNKTEIVTENRAKSAEAHLHRP